MKTTIISFACCCLLASTASAEYDLLVWANRTPDMNAASSWNDKDGNISSIAPSANAVLCFSTNAVVQPVLTSSMTVIGLHFHSHTNSTKANVPRVHPADGEGGYNYSGYRITGEPGAVLTLDGNVYNNGWTRDLDMATKGTNSIAVPVVFTDNREHRLNVTGGRFVFEKPVSTHATSTFHVGTGPTAGGRVVFASPNPDFVPKQLHIFGFLAIADPAAVSGVTNFYSDCWGWGTDINGFASEKCCRIINETDEPAVINAEVFSLGDTDAFYFDGGPFPMSNTVFNSTLRGSTIGGSANVTVKKIVCTASDSRTFNKAGSGTFINLGDFCRTNTATNELRVSQGAYVAMTPDGLSLLRNVLWGDTTTFNSIGARIGVNFDYAPEHSSDNDGDLRFYHWNRPEGFAAVGGERHIKLYNGALLRRGLTHPVTSGNWKQFANTMGFGAEGTDGTVVLDNNIDLNISSGNAGQNETSVSVWDGDAFVDARFAGSVTNAPDSNPTHLWVRLSKKEAGVLALDGPCYVTSDGRVYAGGLLVNNTIACKYIVYDGAWIGGTGHTLGLEIQSGGGLRPGEQGGELDVTGSVSFADGAKIIVDVGNAGLHGCANFTGKGVNLEAAGGIVVEPRPIGTLERAGRVKILDWSAAEPNLATAFDLSRYSVAFDDKIFAWVRLRVEGAAMYMSYAVLNNRHLTIKLR